MNDADREVLRKVIEATSRLNAALQGNCLRRKGEASAINALLIKALKELEPIGGPIDQPKR